MTRRLRESHLERSHYTRVVPDSYIEQTPAAQTPSRFHPVPSRNVFSHPAQTAPGVMPLLMGPAESYNAFPDNPANPNMDSMILERAPDGLGPPIYQPEASQSDESSVLTPELDLNSVPEDTGMPETLPAPLDSDQDQLIPPELERPKTQNDKVTHRDLIQYPYTLDTERPYSDWVRGIEPSQPGETQASSNQRLELSQDNSAHSRLRSNAGWRNQAIPLPVASNANGQLTRPVGFQTQEFAPPVYVAPFVDGQSARPIPTSSNRTTPPQKVPPQKVPPQKVPPQKVLRRQTTYGPNPIPPVVQQVQTPARRPIVQNGVPYVPSNDTSHPMFQADLPYLQLQSGQRKEEVHLHSALQDRYRGTTIR